MADPIKKNTRPNGLSLIALSISPEQNAATALVDPHIGHGTPETIRSRQSVGPWLITPDRQNEPRIKVVTPKSATLT
jgi:hypothetical protein